MLTPLQLQQADKLLYCLNTQPITVLSGFAGTGKTTLVSHMLENGAPEGVRVLAPTGKAAYVLNSKGVPATTIHSLLYYRVGDRPVRFKKRDKLPSFITHLIIDESSMIDTVMLEELLSFGVNIMFVGDPFQLPPIARDPNLFSSPDVMLTEIHRTDNTPLLSAATELRNKGTVLPVVCRNNDLKIVSSNKVLSDFLAARLAGKPLNRSQIICGYNKTRIRVNEILRIGPGVNPGEKLMCLKNNLNLGVVNGEQFEVLEHHPHDGTVTLRSYYDLDAEPIRARFCITENVPTRPDHDVIYLTYGYAITCHKSQGSEWEHVYCFNESFGDEPARWSYTAITRAQSTFTLLH